MSLQSFIFFWGGGKGKRAEKPGTVYSKTVSPKSAAAAIFVCVSAVKSTRWQSSSDTVNSINMDANSTLDITSDSKPLFKF